METATTTFDQPRDEQATFMALAADKGFSNYADFIRAVLTAYSFSLDLTKDYYMKEAA